MGSMQRNATSRKADLVASILNVKKLDSSPVSGVDQAGVDQEPFSQREKTVEEYSTCRRVILVWSIGHAIYPK